MKSQTAKTIARIWQRHKDAEPDRSTEYLLAVTAEEASRLFKREIGCGDVTEALVMRGVFQPVEKGAP